MAQSEVDRNLQELTKSWVGTCPCPRFAPLPKELNLKVKLSCGHEQNDLSKNITNGSGIDQNNWSKIALFQWKILSRRQKH